MGFAGEPNCKSGFAKGRRAPVPHPEEGAAQAACSDERAQLSKPQRPKVRS